jgi:ABC-type branched-subunit amino acid transport system permease subunit
VSARQRLFPSMTPARWIGVAVLTVLAAAFPLADRDQYVLTVVVTALVLLVLNTSWNFVLGVAGVWNFGQLAIYALHLAADFRLCRDRPVRDH